MLSPLENLLIFQKEIVIAEIYSTTYFTPL
nr:MAG TPA: DOR family protein [Crassvirales sp.]